MKNKMIAFIALLSVISAGVIYSPLTSDNPHFPCLTQYHAHNNGVRANMLMRFHFDDTSGFGLCGKLTP